jgi:hypothetical protein
VVHGSNVRVQLWDGRDFDASVTARSTARLGGASNQCELIACGVPGGFIATASW